MTTLHRPDNALTEGAIGKTLLMFSLPILFSNVLQSLNATVNTMWVGRYLGEAALTATSNANMVMFLLFGSVFGVGMASSIMIGQAIGAKNVDQAKRVAGASALLFAVVAVLTAVLGYAFAPQLLVKMSTPPDAMPYAIAYLRIIFLAMPSMFGGAFIMMVLRGAGDAKTPFWFMLLGVVLDIALNPLLIFGLGPIPAMGVAGSAAATLIGGIVSLAVGVAYLVRKKHFLLLRGPELAYLRPDRALLGMLLKKGLPMGVQMIVMSASMLVMMSLVNRYGSRTAAAFAACLQLWNYIQMPSFAIMAGVSTMAAQNVGAQRWDRVRGVALGGVMVNFALTGSLVLLVYVLARHVLGVFLPADAAALEIARHINDVVVWSFVFFGISMVLSGVVRSTGAVMPPLLILVFALWVVRIPFAYLMTQRWAEDAIWWSFPLGALISMLLSTAYYRFGGWRRARMLPAGAASPPPATAPAAGANDEAPAQA